MAHSRRGEFYLRKTEELSALLLLDQRLKAARERVQATLDTIEVLDLALEEQTSATQQALSLLPPLTLCEFGIL
jgi:hypothetical protein